MIFIDVDREEPVALAVEWEPRRSVFIIDIVQSTERAGRRYAVNRFNARFVNDAMGFILINLEGKVRLGPLTEEGLIVGVVRLGSGSFALMQTGRLIELSEAMFEPG